MPEVKDTAHRFTCIELENEPPITWCPRCNLAVSSKVFIAFNLPQCGDNDG
jgi:Zn finger protein HypA/HybF involved in hydrogenase expression